MLALLRHATIIISIPSSSSSWASHRPPRHRPCRASITSSQAPPHPLPPPPSHSPPSPSQPPPARSQPPPTSLLKALLLSLGEEECDSRCAHTIHTIHIVNTIHTINACHTIHTIHTNHAIPAAPHSMVTKLCTGC